MDPPISLGLQAELLTHFPDEAAELRELVPGSLGWWVADLEFLTPPRALASLTRMNLVDSVYSFLPRSVLQKVDHTASCPSLGLRSD